MNVVTECVSFTSYLPVDAIIVVVVSSFTSFWRNPSVLGTHHRHRDGRVHPGGSVKGIKTLEGHPCFGTRTFTRSLGGAKEVERTSLYPKKKRTGVGPTYRGWTRACRRRSTSGGRLESGPLGSRTGRQGRYTDGDRDTAVDGSTRPDPVDCSTRTRGPFGAPTAPNRPKPSRSRREGNTLSER